MFLMDFQCFDVLDILILQPMSLMFCRHFHAFPMHIFPTAKPFMQFLPYRALCSATQCTAVWCNVVWSSALQSYAVQCRKM